MKIYRIEHPIYDCGAYCTRGKASRNDKLCEDHNNRDDRPGFMGDYDSHDAATITKMKLIKGSNCRYGCPSISSFLEWFEGHWEEMNKNGYKVAIYLANDKYVSLGKSGLQCIFCAQHANRQEYIGIDEFLSLLETV